MFFYNLLKYIACIFFILALIVLGYLFQAIKGAGKFKVIQWSFKEFPFCIGSILYGIAGKWCPIIVTASSIALLLTSTTVHQLVGINNLELKPDGTYCFYVEATRDKNKTYTLPAQIRIETESEEAGEGRSKTFRYYYIEKVIFSDREYLDTEELENVQINKTSSFRDERNNEWKLVLLNEHAYSPAVIETNNATWPDIIILSLEIVLILIFLYSIFKYDELKKSSLD